ncbi:carboxymuconolactone decarboxylase family protein [Novosphingobium panipatense]
MFAEVWARPGLPRRARFLVALASAATCGLADTQLDDFVRGALTTEALTLVELREAALHLAVYSGWGNGGRLDRAVTRMSKEKGSRLPRSRRSVPRPGIRRNAWPKDTQPSTRS